MRNGYTPSSVNFITPKSEISWLFRDAVLQLARHHDFARRMVNSGRLSVPATLHESELNTADADGFTGRMVPGAVAADAPVADGWLLRRLGGARFAALVFGDGEGARASLRALAEADLPLATVRVPLDADHAVAAARYDAQDGTTYLLRPDQHVCARWRKPTAAAVRAAHGHALAKN